jgi:anti-sigma B factor antagonist
MSNGPANLSVWVTDDIVCIRIAGRASFHSSVDFKTLINNLRQKGHPRFVLDLSECQLMDSTFLGVLAGLGLKFNQQANGFPAPSIELLNPSPRISELLENLGIAHLFKQHEGRAPASDQPGSIAQIDCKPDRKEVSRTCLEAHKLLMEINPANVAKFKDVTKFLEEDLKKLEQ